MTIALAVDGLIVALAVALAAWIVAARTMIGAVVGFLAFGLIVTLGWMRLGAPDVALTEAAVGSGLSGVLVLGAMARLGARRTAAGPTGVAAAGDNEAPIGAVSRLLTGTLCAAVAAALGAVVLTLPDPAPSLAELANERLPALDLGNPVTGVLIGFRALDTLLEKVVLLLALIGVWSLAGDGAWKDGARPRSLRGEACGATTLIARVLPPIGIVIAVYLVWNGASAPGGVFPAGTVLAAMWLLAAMAGLAPMPSVTGRWLRVALVAGPAVFIAVALAGFFIADGFLAFPARGTKAWIVFVETMVTVSIAATLAMLLAGPPEEAVRP